MLIWCIFFYLRNLLSPPLLCPPPPPPLSLYLPTCWQNVCMLMVCDVGQVVDILVACPLCVFKAPPVSLTACHSRQIFQSVTFLQKKWNHPTHSENKVISYNFFHGPCVSAFKDTSSAASECKREELVSLYLEADVWRVSGLRRTRHILNPELQSCQTLAWRSLRELCAKTLDVYIYITCYCFFQHLFNKSKKGCKQNALCRSSRDWRVCDRRSCHGEDSARTRPGSQRDAVCWL